MGKSNLIDLTGQVFGHLIVMRQAPSKNGKTMWTCNCELCGSVLNYSGDGLRRGRTTSCGCQKQSPHIWKGAVIRDLPRPKELSCQYLLSVGDMIKLKGKNLKLIGKYENYGRFEDKYGIKECWSWWDIERMLRGIVE